MSFVLLSLLLVAYALPWMVVPSVSGLTVNAYDLAEWASIHPAVRADTLLLTPLLLRLPLVCLALWIACQPGTRWLRLLIVALLSAASLPPLEFFTIAQGDTNYQQQFSLALAAQVGGLVVLAIGSLHERIPPAIIKMIATIAIIGAITAIWGLIRAQTLFREIAMDVQTGSGGVLFLVVVAVTVGWQVSHKWQKTRHQ